MKYTIPLLIALLVVQVHPQTPLGRKTGFGIVLGEPTGLTIKTAWSKQTDLSASLGSSYFGALRIGVDWTWNFDAFHDPTVHLYIGPGIALGIGGGSGILYRSVKGDYYYRASGETGLGIRGVIGTSGMFKDEPFEFFMELGPMIGLVPAIGSSFDLALGVRFYP